MISSSAFTSTAKPFLMAMVGAGSTEAEASTALLLSAATWSGNGRLTVSTSEYLQPGRFQQRVERRGVADAGRVHGELHALEVLERP